MGVTEPKFAFSQPEAVATVCQVTDLIYKTRLEINPKIFWSIQCNFQEKKYLQTSGIADQDGQHYNGHLGAVNT